MKHKNRKSGFTLVELIVVIMIILILSAVLVPNLLKYINKAKKAKCAETKRSLTTEMIADYALSGKLPEDGDLTIPPDMSERYKCSSGGAYIAKCENGIINIYCPVHDEGEAPGESSGYTPVRVADSAKDYKPALDAVLKTIYDSVVADRLKEDKNHVSWVLIKNGKVDTIYCYGSETDKKGHVISSYTSENLTDLNNKITEALKNTGYKLTTNTTERIFFDWEGNILSDSNGIGGQNGVKSTINFVTSSSTTNNGRVQIKNNNGEWEK